MDTVDHVVLGAGAVGMAVAEALARRGESVRVVNRSGLREPMAGVQSVAGDVSDPAFAASAIGVSVDNQFTVFGASGAIVFTLLSGLLLAHFTPAPEVTE